MAKTGDTASGARGYAIVEGNGNILVLTVSPHARGAVVNWLFAYAHVMVMNDWPDKLIWNRFDLIKDKHGVRVAEVIISEKIT